MDLKSLMQKLSDIENSSLLESITLKDVSAAILGQEQNPAGRFASLGQFAKTNNLPGLYDPVSGSFVDNTGSESSSDDNTDRELSRLGLIPANAKTSSHMFGNDHVYDAATKYKSDLANQASDRASTQQAALQDISSMIDQYKALKDYIAKTKKPEPKPAMESIKISDQLLESFGYTSEDATTSTAGKIASSVGGRSLAKAVPFVGSAISAKDAYDRLKKGDIEGAGIAALAGASYFIPGIGWAVGTGLDVYNATRDLEGEIPEEQPTQPVSWPSTRDEIVSFQTANGLTPDGLIGEKTYAILAQQGATPPPEFQLVQNKVNTNQPSLAESIRLLQAKLDMINEGVTVEEEPILIQGKDGKKYAMTPEGLFDENDNPVDPNTLTPIDSAVAEGALGAAIGAGKFAGKAAWGGAKKDAGWVKGLFAKKPTPPAQPQPIQNLFKKNAKPSSSKLGNAAKIGGGMAAGAALDHVFNQGGDIEPIIGPYDHNTTTNPFANSEVQNAKFRSDMELDQLRARIESRLKTATPDAPLKPQLDALKTKWAEISKL